MKIINLSDSETGRETYEKDIEHSPQTPVLNTTIPQAELNNTKNDAHTSVIENKSSE